MAREPQVRCGWARAELPASHPLGYYERMGTRPISAWPPEEDPVVAMLLQGEANSVAEAEGQYLDSHLADVIDLVNSPLSEDQFRRHPLIQMLLAHGGREWEDWIG